MKVKQILFFISIVLACTLLACTPLLDTPIEDTTPTQDIPQDDTSDDIETPEDIFYSITFVSNNEIILQYTLKHNLKINNIPTVSKEGYNFVGWFVDDIIFDFESYIISDITLQAQFEEKIFHTVNFYDFGRLQATYTIEHGTTFHINEPINYQQKAHPWESKTPFTTYWKLNDSLYTTDDSVIVDMPIDFHIFRKLDELYSLKSDECVLMPWTGAATYFRSTESFTIDNGETITFNSGDVRFSPTWNFAQYKFDTMFKHYGNMSGKQLVDAQLIVLISTNVNATNAQEFVEGLVQPIAEDYTAMAEPTLLQYVHGRGIGASYNLQPNTEYRMWLATIIYENLYMGFPYVDQITTRIVNVHEEFLRNSHYTFTTNGGMIRANHY